MRSDKAKERSSKAELRRTALKLMMTTKTSIVDGGKIMRLFKRHIPRLPTNIRHILKTSLSCPPTVIGSGLYYHIGLRSIRTPILSCWCQFASFDCVNLQLNVDGLPLFNNGTQQVWP
ncbi:unnamed protein product [Trichobilharzia regenti]|nr:unnamed protein product [Trichobilharzia regenti]